MAEEIAKLEKEKKSNFFKYILLFVLFLAVGIVIGVYGAMRYMAKKDNNEPMNNVPEIKDITNDSVYQNTINSLYSIVNNNSIFYSSKGVDIGSIDNSNKLSLIYQYILSNNEYTKETLNKIDANYCDYNFILDSSGDANIPSLVCTVYKFKKEDVTSLGKKLFNDSTIIVDGNFNPSSTELCVSVDDSYICGNIATAQSGTLEIKFNIQKVTMNTDGTIEIYDKGYLNDKREGVDNPNDQYDNYYLHSSDSTEYYYELKSADNLTFKHTFKTDDNANYYYVSTEVFKE